ncbi:MAG TPA: hypothetical protein VF041_10460 [Gemmatimonadaceae bacterium]
MTSLERDPSAGPTPQPGRSDPGRAERWEAWVTQCWPAVRIAHVDVRTASAGAHDAPRVRATVHLGPLLPADVRVEAVIGGEIAAAGPEERERQVIRLWSAHSYGNDAYLFESPTPPDWREGADAVTIRVCPRTRFARAPQLELTKRLTPDDLAGGTPATDPRRAGAGRGGDPPHDSARRGTW